VPRRHRPRTSSSARATGRSTTMRARSSAARPRWCVTAGKRCCGTRLTTHPRCRSRSPWRI
jgi:hypothetical protein